MRLYGKVTGVTVEYAGTTIISGSGGEGTDYVVEDAMVLAPVGRKVVGVSRELPAFVITSIDEATNTVQYSDAGAATAPEADERFLLWPLEATYYATVTLDENDPATILARIPPSISLASGARIPGDSETVAIEEGDGEWLLVDVGSYPANLDSDVGGAVPIGTIVMWPASILPDGWLACDGTAYWEADFPELYRVIGQGYLGPGHSLPDGQFEVPDFTGRFPAGAGGGAGSPGTVGGEWNHGHTVAATGQQSTGDNLTQVPTTGAQSASKPVHTHAVPDAAGNNPAFASVLFIIRAF